MKYLGLDLGTTTLGVSIKHEKTDFVSPYSLITFKSGDYNTALSKLMDIIKKEGICEVVLGLPKNMDNTLGFASDRSLKFKSMLESEGIVVHLEDERLTTVEAINIMKNNGVKKINKSKKTDVLSAVLILESFIKRSSNEKQISDK